MDTTEERRIAEAATPGAWWVQNTTACYDVIQGGDRTSDSRYIAMMDSDPPKTDAYMDNGYPIYPNGKQDAEFIAHARTGYPLALAVVEAAEAVDWDDVLNCVHSMAQDDQEPDRWRMGYRKAFNDLRQFAARLDAWHTGGTG